MNVDINLAISYVHRVVERLEINQPYLCFPVDLKYRRLDNPYASQQRLQRRNGVDHGPVSLDTLRLYEVAPIEMKGLQGVAMALERVKPVISEYLKNHDYCPIGDCTIISENICFRVMGGTMQLLRALSLFRVCFISD